MDGVRRLDVALLGLVLAAVLAGTLVAVGAGGGDTAFLDVPQRPTRLAAAEVERAVRTAPDPATGRGRGRAASCRSRGRGVLRNPWSCTVTYAGGRRVRFRVTVSEDGSYSGRAAGGGSVRGCCLRLP